MPNISVIIANWNGKHFLNECLTALRRQSFRDFETILVDNGSSDGSDEYVRSEFPEVRLIRLEENRGFTGGNLSGYQAARGNLIVLLNNDTQAHPEWLRELHAGSLRFPDAGSFSSKMMYFDDRSRIENCGFELGIACTTVEVGRDEIDGPEWSRTRTVFGACGGAAAYRRSMLDDIGFLDPDLVMIYEDVDLAFRAQLAGYGCVHLPRAIVYHRYRSTLKQRPALQVYYAQRNIDLVYLKNLPFELMVISTPQRLLYEIGAGIHFFRHGIGFAFLRAKLDVVKQVACTLKKREVIQRGRRISNRQLRVLLRASALNAKWRKFFSPQGNDGDLPARSLSAPER
jgi:GT2 family glycosyltransferase